MGSRLIKGSLSKELSHPATLWSAAAQPSPVHMGQVSGDYVNGITMWHHIPDLFPTSPKSGWRETLPQGQSCHMENRTMTWLCEYKQTFL